MKYFTLALLLVSLNAFSQTETESENAPQTVFEFEDSLGLERTEPDSIFIVTSVPIEQPSTVIEDQKSEGTGSLKLMVTFNYNSGCITNNLILTSKKDTFEFLHFKANDTLTNIPAGNYHAYFYDCDSSHQYGQLIEIVANETNVFSYFNNPSNSIQIDEYYDDYERMYTNSNNSTSVWLNHGIQFGRGLDYEHKSVKVESNYSFQYSIGQDYRIQDSPTALGFDFGLRYAQSNFEKTDFIDTTLVHEKYRFSNYSLSSAFLMSFYIKDKKFMDVGVLYILPLYSRVISVNGNQKTSTKEVHNFKDIRFVAHVGYWWGFVFAEYRPDSILKAPYEDAPKLTLGLRFNIPLEWW